ncbi:unnamed protein product [Nyctereutes procyonoides]|uniref:(raccoon dog) hypothetical protein n=1 Tax=Nyctereutes procyonoides TaxID=34880 RepID=A0A811YD78_NYCPR|nr:unnamed protein product [Nyctereutes procyonoides]
MENAQQENEEQGPVQNEEESHNSRGSEERFVPNFRWAIPNKHIDHNEMGDDVEKFVGQMMEIRRKTKE